MPLPKPRKDEEHQPFIDRCMADEVMREEFPDVKQRYAVCQRRWNEREESAMADILEFRAAAKPKTAELLIYGPIVSSSGGLFGSDEDVTPGALRKQLAALEPIDEIDVFINSPGGDPFAGHAIYNMLRRHEAKKHVYIEGMAASAASLIAMAGDTITMPRNALMVVHQPSGLAIGTADDMRQMAANLEQVEEAMAATYSARTGKNREEILAIMRAETWFTAEEAIAAKFADVLDEAKPIAASLEGNLLAIGGRQFDISAFRNPHIRAGVVPADVSREKAGEGEAWSAPTLEDFTDKSWDELTDGERRRIAGHFAWAASMPPETYGDLKLPHHRASDGKVVWRGVANAMARLDQSDIPAADRGKVRSHLKSHYSQFDKESPDSQARVGDDKHQAPASQEATGTAPDAERQARLRVLRLRARA